MKYLIWVIAEIALVFVIAMEYYQKWYVPSRGFEVKDMIADAAGVLLALPLYQLWKKRH